MLGEDSKYELPPTVHNPMCIVHVQPSLDNELLRSSRNPSGNIAEPFLQDMTRWILGASISSSSKCVWWSILDSCGRGKCSRIHPLWKRSNFGGNMSGESQPWMRRCKDGACQALFAHIMQILEGHYVLLHFCYWRYLVRHLHIHRIFQKIIWTLERLTYRNSSSGHCFFEPSRPFAFAVAMAWERKGWSIYYMISH